MQQTLTPKQKEVLDFIRRFIDDHDYAPSYREIGRFLGLSSPATVAEHVEALRQKGWLEKSPAEARSIKVTPAWNELNDSIPLLGIIAAGKPIQAITSTETIEIPRSMMAPDVYALKVAGDSMINDGILDGDYVIIKRTKQPRNGEIVVALLDEDQVTLKRYYKEKDCICLQPANGNYPPIRTRDVTIQGTALGVIRQLSKIF